MNAIYVKFVWTPSLVKFVGGFGAVGLLVEKLNSTLRGPSPYTFRANTTNRYSVDEFNPAAVKYV